MAYRMKIDISANINKEGYYHNYHEDANII